SADQMIRRIDLSTGILSTVAGSRYGIGHSGDGGLASAAKVWYPSALAIDFTGNVFFADENNDRVRKISASTGIITTVAGNGVFADNGDGGTATSASVSHPIGLALDHNGTLYVSDSTFSVRKITAITGIQEIKPEPSFLLYPNPGSGDFTFHATGMGYSSFTVYDMTGKVIYAETLNALEENPLLHLHLDVAEGIYLASIERGRERLSRKIIVRK
ncbi:MAG TPA: T9SS type A sorting domain-containing protein, partial [Bacteroidia bacterium]|nr:T9SS type A sorting domain-containing protein [Bacteroidia bacterium]